MNKFLRKLCCAIGYVYNREKSQSLIRENLASLEKS